MQFCRVGVNFGASGFVRFSGVFEFSFARKRKRRKKL